MPKFRVYMLATASRAIEVEAEDADAAEDMAHQTGNFPFFPAGMDGDIGEWYADEIEEIES